MISRCLLCTYQHPSTHVNTQPPKPSPRARHRRPAVPRAGAPDTVRQQRLQPQRRRVGVQRAAQAGVGVGVMCGGLVVVDWERGGGGGREVLVRQRREGVVGDAVAGPVVGVTVRRRRRGLILFVYVCCVCWLVG